MDDSKEHVGKPPYGSFQTFWSFVDSLGTKQLPPRIDRSLLDGKSGSDQIGILMALRFFGLVAGDDNRVQPTLLALAGNKDSRKVQLNELLYRMYPRQFEVSNQHGTEKMLLESFEETFGLTGDTRRKAATFFLHAAREAGITVSAHFPKVRSGPGALPGRQRTPKRKPIVPPRPDTENGDHPTEDEYTVQLRAGGTVTLKVAVSHFALGRNKDDRQFVNDLIDALTNYQQDAGEDTEG